MALQRAGLGAWRITLLTISIVQPSQSSNQMPCQKRFGRYCKSNLLIKTFMLMLITICDGLVSIATRATSGTDNQVPCKSIEAACRWCLDKTGLSVPLVIIIIAFGSAVLVFVAILILVIREVRKHSGEVSSSTRFQTQRIPCIVVSSTCLCWT